MKNVSSNLNDLLILSVYKNLYHNDNYNLSI